MVEIKFYDFNNFMKSCESPLISNARVSFVFKNLFQL